MSWPVVLLSLPFAFYLLALILWHVFRRILIKQTGLLDLPLLREAIPSNSRIGGTVVICGGSVGGLVAARICHDFFDRIVIVESEAWLSTSAARSEEAWTQREKRARVMQYKSLHGTLGFCFLGLCAMFDNFEAECAKSKIHVGPMDLKFTFAGQTALAPWKSYGGTLPKTCWTSRQGLETLVRRLVLGSGKYPRIELRIGTVTGIVPDPKNRTRLSHVVMRGDAGMEELAADLIVDCTGVSRSGLKWLERAGYGYGGKYSKTRLPLDQLRVSFDHKLYYCTVIFDLTAEELAALPVPGGLPAGGNTFVYQDSLPGEIPKFIFAMKVDGGQLVVCAGECGSMQQLNDMADFKAFAADIKLETPLPQYIFDLFDQLQDKMDKCSVSRVRVCTDLPTNFIAMGDSCMTVNPRFGQGCTKALLSAVTLHTLLRKERARAIERSAVGRLSNDFASRFFKEQYQKSDVYWQGSRLIDYGSPVTTPVEGESLSEGTLLRKYAYNLQAVCLKDEHAARALFDSAMSLGTSIDIFHPSLILKVLLQATTGYYYTAKGK
ncbi:hypothetical protein FISHEDRAFT_54977 [Fistulina hepatica ATCC 64428]|uniref:FAD/NAD(P)-binding domain-containing protein n=1 Tax=Fistulina hepatica ATCC 64428 TaxID=1128425 RepID=A0A0D7ASF3_9AGAR|nr:hypothetical protein FISHEDRAFT_54977 [Fistulina hepatica ATCC 64428]